jgi:hypothetical protein
VFDGHGIQRDAAPISVMPGPADNNDSDCDKCGSDYQPGGRALWTLH